MRDRDELAKYICDKIEATLKRYGRILERVGDHALIVCIEPYPATTRWRIVVRRTGGVEFEPTDLYAARNPIPKLQEHIADALADEYDFSASKDGNGGRVVMQPRALPKAPYALPAST